MVPANHIRKAIDSAVCAEGRTTPKDIPNDASLRPFALSSPSVLTRAVHHLSHNRLQALAERAPREVAQYVRARGAAHPLCRGLHL